ncbi:MAG: DUF192 domain-containing protein [Planctomycetes bacterium]|nr:DUF192 domain-containing protein [Planctomycetota bacterium]
MNILRIALIFMVAAILILPACDDNATPTPIAIQTTPSQSNESITLILEHTGEPWSEAFINGLSGRTSLEGGMIFDFKETVTFGFQMRETLIPLSIAFISEEYILVDIQDMEPLASNSYPPANPYRYAIEVNQGYFEENKIAIGDRIEFQEETQPGFVTITFPR